MASFAYVFPGQGSQSVGMLADLAQQYPLVVDAFSQVSDRLGYDLWALVQQGPEQQLNQTAHTQAAVLTADVAVHRVLRQQGARQASLMAGHSLGEYAALVCAEAIDLVDAAALVAIRGQLMQDTIPLGLGAMAAIVGLSDDQVRSLCADVSLGADQRVSPANYNALGQVVVAGHSTTVQAAVDAAQALGARMAKVIPVSVPCHCDLLLPAAEQFAEALQQAPFRLPQAAVISNVDLSVYRSVDQIKTLLAQQLHQPVRWVETVQGMAQQGMTLAIECGPGKVLSGLIKRIDKSVQTFSVNEPLGVVEAVGLSLSH